MEVIQVTGEIWGLETPRKVFWRYPLKAGLGFEWNKFYDSVFILHYMCIFFKHCFLDIPSDAFGEGNGSPLQCFCLENPRDRGAWWAAIYGVTQSRTRLKRFSSSREAWCAVIHGVVKSRTRLSDWNDWLKTLRSERTASSQMYI